LELFDKPPPKEVTWEEVTSELMLNVQQHARSDGFILAQRKLASAG